MPDDLGESLGKAAKTGAPAVVGGAVAGPIGAVGAGTAAHYLADNSNGGAFLGAGLAVGTAQLLTSRPSNNFAASDAKRRRGLK